ncbi:MAG: cation diffusion facilitator family transporter [Oscillospiraceae bacterium]|nr:cation diffusion facilitator family transporter [Oscillospiraceae bacterium]
MSGLLAKWFIKDAQRVQDPKVRSAYGKMSGIVGLLCNLLLCAGKLAVGWLSGSVAVTADAVNNLSDASSSVITLLGFKLSEKPADKGHPFGHARIEYLSGLLVAVMILLIGAELVRSSIEKILAPTPVSFQPVTFVVLAFSILVKCWMAHFYRETGKRIESETLSAAAADSRNDVISTSAVLLAMLAAHFTHLQLDGWMGLAVAVFILVSGVGILRDTLNPLLGEAPTEELSRHIAEKILAYPGVLGVHDLMVHDYGPGRRFASVHVEMSAATDVLVSHDTIDDIERDFARDDNLNLVIHYDPVVVDDEEVNAMRSRVKEIIAGISSELSFHDFRMVKGPGHTNLIFDVVCPNGFFLTEEQLKAEIDRRVQQAGHRYYTVITVDTNYASLPVQTTSGAR